MSVCFERWIFNKRMLFDLTIFDINEPGFVKDINNKVKVKFFNKNFLGELKQIDKLLGKWYVLLKSFRIINWKNLDGVDSLLGKGDYGCEFVEVREGV